MVRIVLNESEAKWLLYFLDRADNLMFDSGCNDVDMKFNEENKSMLKRLYSWQEEIAEPEMDRNSIDVDTFYAVLDSKSGKFKSYSAPYFSILDYLIGSVEAQSGMTTDSILENLT